MKNSDIKINVSDIPAFLAKVVRKVAVYAAFIFFLLVASLYGFILWRINVFSNAPASQVDPGNQANVQPRIDAATIEKLESLEDNSVSVQSLFDEARENPFQE